MTGGIQAFPGVLEKLENNCTVCIRFGIMIFRKAGDVVYFTDNLVTSYLFCLLGDIDG